MKNGILLLLVLSGLGANAQRYYPALKNLMLQNVAEESVFNNEITYVRDGFKTAINKVWYSNLQTSNGTNAAFYSMELVPKWIYEVDFLDTGVLLVFNQGLEDRTKGIPLTFHEYAQVTETEKLGNGWSQTGDGLALQFPLGALVPYDTAAKKVIPSAKTTFTISGFTYKFENNGEALNIIVTGTFTTGIQLNKKNIPAGDVKNIIFNASKSELTVSMDYTDSKKREQTVILVTKKTGA